MGVESFEPKLGGYGNQQEQDYRKAAFEVYKNIHKVWSYETEDKNEKEIIRDIKSLTNSDFYYQTKFELNYNFYAQLLVAKEIAQMIKNHYSQEYDTKLYTKLFVNNNIQTSYVEKVFKPITEFYYNYGLNPQNPFEPDVINDTVYIRSCNKITICLRVILTCIFLQAREYFLYLFVIYDSSYPKPHLFYLPSFFRVDRGVSF